jgi:hypothetical protein
MFKRCISPVLALCAATMVCTPAKAVQAPQAMHAEIGELFKRMQAAKCQFNRNSSWYSAAEAREHLTKKLVYFEDRGAIRSTEDFISVAATKTSLSGKQYLVQCTGMAPLESNLWLQEQLKDVRSGSRRP